MAEQRFLSNYNTWDFDNAWQEMLNHATIKVMEAEKQKSDSEAEHLKRAASFQAAEQEVQRLQVGGDFFWKNSQAKWLLFEKTQFFYFYLAKIFWAGPDENLTIFRKFLAIWQT